MSETKVIREKPWEGWKPTWSGIWGWWDEWLPTATEDPIVSMRVDNLEGSFLNLFLPKNICRDIKPYYTQRFVINTNTL